MAITLMSMYEKDDRPELSYPGGAKKTLECDVAVVGGGGSGLTAAVRAAELGAKVVLIEKMDILGGNTRFAGGLLSTNSKFQKEAGMPDMTKEYYKKAYHEHKYTLDPRIFKRYIANTGAYVEWLADKGLDMENTKWVMDAVLMIKERTEPGPLNNPAYGPGLIASSIIGLLEKHMKESESITCLTSAKVTGFLMNGGAVTGVKAEGQDASYEISAKSVIISSGGFGANTKLLRRFLPQYFSRDNIISHYCMLSTTGELIEMAEDIGAEVGKNISIGMAPISHIPGAYSIQRVIRDPRGIIVNKNGARFIAEDDLDDAEFAMDMQPDALAYFLFDEELKSELHRYSVENGCYGDRNPEWEEFCGDLARENEEGKVRISRTIEGLAEFIGCTPEQLKKTVDEINAAFEKGADDDLLKAGEHLRPVRTAPFYAVRINRNFDVTMGGISVNHNLEVLKPDQSPIPGLYAAGDVASNWMGTEYGPLFSSFAWAMNSGYLAAEEAVSRH